MDNNPKPWWQSWTVWWNVVSFVGATALFLQGQALVQENPQLVVVLGGVVSVVNFLLRFKTTSTIFLSKPKE